MQYPDHPPQHPLADAIHMLIESYILAHHHVEIRNGQYTELDVTLVDRLRETVWIHYFRCAEMAETVHRGIESQLAPAIETARTVAAPTSRDRRRLDPDMEADSGDDGNPNSRSGRGARRPLLSGHRSGHRQVFELPGN